MKDEREKGNKEIKIGYKKINIKGMWYRWNDKEERKNIGG